MKIRKLYKIESAHIVRGAISTRCSKSYHGHGGKIEVFFQANHLDDAGMVYDFGAMKNTVGSFIDMFDHSVHLWSKDKQENIDFFTKENNRFIILPFNPTAENYALFFKEAINNILEECTFTNGEGMPYCCGVRYHETDTGYAESDAYDTYSYGISSLKISKNTYEETSSELKKILNKLGVTII